MTFGPAFRAEAPEVGGSLIYVFRSPTISGFAMSAKPMLVIDGKTTFPIKIGGYLPIHLNPGEHRLVLKRTVFGKVLEQEVASIDFKIDAGETKYFEYAQVTTGYERYGATEVAKVKEFFMEVPAKYGAKKLIKTKLLGN